MAERPCSLLSDFDSLLFKNEISVVTYGIKKNTIGIHAVSIRGNADLVKSAPSNLFYDSQIHLPLGNISIIINSDKEIYNYFDSTISLLKAPPQKEYVKNKIILTVNILEKAEYHYEIAVKDKGLEFFISRDEIDISSAASAITLIVNMIHEVSHYDDYLNKTDFTSVEDEEYKAHLLPFCIMFQEFKSNVSFDIDREINNKDLLLKMLSPKTPRYISISAYIKLLTNIRTKIEGGKLSIRNIAHKNIIDESCSIYI